jgi:TonB family protein
MFGIHKAQLTTRPLLVAAPLVLMMLANVQAQNGRPAPTPQRSDRGVLLGSSTMLTLAVAARTLGQSPGGTAMGEKCDGPIYEPQEVSQRPKFGPRTSPDLTPEALAHGVRGRVVLSAVLCRTGRVTDVQVIEGLPFGMTEKVIEAARQIKFEPAESNGHRVSEVTRFEYEFSYIGDRRLPAHEPIAGRNIEGVEITGLRSRTSEEIMLHLRTRPGESYGQQQITSDLRSILALGFFDRIESRVRIEEGSRGGVNVIFELVELPPK